MDLSEPAFEVGREAEQAFAELVDCFREYRDCADMYSESAKFEVYDALQAHSGDLLRLQMSLCRAERKVQLKFGSDAGPGRRHPPGRCTAYSLCSKYCGNPEYSLRSPYLLYSK
ncbi:hypothetical protein VAPA_2c13100 [Variovorax paradoxus B4]|uniref:Uncharacterized protein n=1 Tax=Variovorax paradoxus B4 TaxID=1246301 RepID=T1XLU5_VARPD|nr:hypothetical protein VAPA_2c13100 [Variovorax paradoxus B4]